MLAGVTDAELSSIAERLRSGADPHSYTLLMVLGRMEALRYRGLIEHFMRQIDNLELTRLALQILGIWWPGNGRYMPEVARFANGVEWDDEA